MYATAFIRTLAVVKCRFPSLCLKQKGPVCLVFAKVPLANSSISHEPMPLRVLLILHLMSHSNIPLLLAADSHPESLLISTTCRFKADIRFNVGSLGLASEVFMYAPWRRWESTSMIFGATSLMSSSFRSMVSRIVPSHSRR